MNLVSPWNANNGFINPDYELVTISSPQNREVFFQLLITKIGKFIGTPNPQKPGESAMSPIRWNLVSCKVGGCPTFRTASDRLERAKDFEGSGLTGAFSRLEIHKNGRFLF